MVLDVTLATETMPALEILPLTLPQPMGALEVLPSETWGRRSRARTLLASRTPACIQDRSNASIPVNTSFRNRRPPRPTMLALAPKRRIRSYLRNWPDHKMEAFDSQRPEQSAGLPLASILPLLPHRRRRPPSAQLQAFGLLVGTSPLADVNFQCFHSLSVGDGSITGNGVPARVGSNGSISTDIRCLEVLLPKVLLGASTLKEVLYLWAVIEALAVSPAGHALPRIPLLLAFSPML